MNNKAIFFFTIFILFFSHSVYSQASDSTLTEKHSLDSLLLRLPAMDLGIRIPQPANPDLKVTRSWTNNAFETGEHLVFDVAYGPARAGTATMSIKDTMTLNGRLCYKIETTATSSSFIDTFFKVRDTVRTFIDAEGGFPWFFEKHIREGRYRDNRRVVFDQTNNIATQFRRNRADTLAVPPFVQDVLSSFYYVRTRELEAGRHFDIMNYGDGRLYPLRVLVHRRETVRVPAGTFECLVIEPVLQGEGLFKHEGRLQIWVTDDEYKIPVLMRSRVAVIGSIDCRLRSYSLPQLERKNNKQ